MLKTTASLNAEPVILWYMVSLGDNELKVYFTQSDKNLSSGHLQESKFNSKSVSGQCHKTELCYQLNKTSFTFDVI